MQRLLTALVVHGVVQRTDHSGRMRAGDVADTKADDVGIGVGCLIGRDLVRDGREQIALGQVFVMAVNLHGFDFSSLRLQQTPGTADAHGWGVI